jgi:exodeoxyribonuclease VII large subunit
LNPLNVLKRGYSLTLLKGKVLKDVTLVTKADIIDTRLQNGTITSTVEDIRKEKNSEQAEENYLFTGDRRA